VLTSHQQKRPAACFFFRSGQRGNSRWSDRLAARTLALVGLEARIPGAAATWEDAAGTQESGHGNAGTK